MNIGQVESALKEKFEAPLKDRETRKVVFWIDQDKAFAEDIQHLRLEGVKVHTLTENNQFYTKYLLEEEDPASSYLIYTHLECETEDNWLLDTVLYAERFYADRVSLLLNDLKIDPALRAVIKRYEKFFRNKARVKRFREYKIETYTEETIELAIMSALCHVPAPDFAQVLKKVLMDTLADDENTYLVRFDKYFDRAVFWRHAARHYGYDRQEKALKPLFIHLAVTAFSHTVEEAHLTQVKEYIASRQQGNALVFIDLWMNHRADARAFDEYAVVAENEIRLPDIVRDLPLAAVQDADIFPSVDQAIIKYIANSLIRQLEDYEAYTALIRLRRTKHYYEKYQHIYEALYYAVRMMAFQKAHRHGLPQGRAIDLFAAYAETYYVMDTYYRKFYVAYDQAEESDLLKKLKTLVENVYTNRFVSELNAHWSQAVERDMKGSWGLPGIEMQPHFYRNIAAPKMEEGRVFVIVSDALRYEIGVELSERLHAETRGVCDVEPLLGVIPSVTKLGMAALLPHKRLEIAENARVLVDGKEAYGLENRRKILETVAKESIAVHFRDVLAMNKAGRRETFKGKKLIYVYHDTIDALGDQASTEVYTFSAVETALDELTRLVKIILGDLSGTNVFITADHGFLYQRDALEESDKIERAELNAIEAKRRYLLSHDTKEVPGLLDISLASVAESDTPLTAYVPNATIRYKMQGPGVNFVHGGASLQEVVVPLLTFKNKRAGQKGAKAVQKVDIKLTSPTQRITNSVFQLAFFQTEKAADKRVPRTVRLYMADDAGEVLSNEAAIIGDRTSDDPFDRTFNVRFVLKSLAYDRNGTYYLIIKDAEAGQVLEKIPFTIDLGLE